MNETHLTTAATLCKDAKSIKVHNAEIFNEDIMIHGSFINSSTGKLFLWTWNTSQGKAWLDPEEEPKVREEVQRFHFFQRLSQEVDQFGRTLEEADLKMVSYDSDTKQTHASGIMYSYANSTKTYCAQTWTWAMDTYEVVLGDEYRCKNMDTMWTMYEMLLAQKVPNLKKANQAVSNDC